MKTKLLASVVALLFLPLLVQATHLYSSYISYTRDTQDPRKINFVFTLYTNSFSQAHDPEITIYMGDGNTVVVPWASYKKYSYGVSKSLYFWSYTYTTAGNYTVSWIGENRNHGIINFPQPSDQLPLYVFTNIQAGALGTNTNGAKLAGVPVFEGHSGEAMTHNLLAYDADGDQLFYDLIPPKTQNKDGSITYVSGYQFPEGLTVNQFGELHWETPGEKGQYIANLLITEKRNGATVGSMVVDLVFHVKEHTKQPTLTLLKQERLTVNHDGSVLARPNQPLKLEYYLQNSKVPDRFLSIKQFGELDTLDLNTPVLAIRDTTDGLAVTLTFTPTPAMQRPAPYLIGMRGRSSGDEQVSSYVFDIEDDWAFVYLVVGEQQPTASGEDLAKLGFKLYPNPTTDKFVIEAPDMPAMQLQLFDATGKAINKLLLRPGRNVLTRPATVTSGLYFYTVSSNSRPVGNGRLVVQ